MMLTYIAAFAVSLIYVGLRSFQQLNVMHAKYWWVPPTSMAMAVSDYWVINQTVNSGMAIALPIGLGGATGACLSIYLHNQWNKRKKQTP